MGCSTLGFWATEGVRGERGPQRAVFGVAQLWPRSGGQGLSSGPVGRRNVVEVGGEGRVGLQSKRGEIALGLTYSQRAEIG